MDRLVNTIATADNWLAQVFHAIMMSIGFIAHMIVDFLWWLPGAVWWFVQWLPARLTGASDMSLPVGETAERGFEYLQSGANAFFDGMSDVFGAIIATVEAILMRPPGENWIRGRGFEPQFEFWNEATHPFVVILAFAVIAWILQRNWKISLLIVVGFLFVIDQDYWEPTMQSMALVLTACIVCMGVGVPIGIAVAHRPKLYRAIVPVLDLMQTLPTFVYLIPAIVFFGIGTVPGLIATVVFVLPAPIRLTQLGISSTPTPLLEAAQAFGATRRQVLWKVELPSALPQIMAGLNQTIMLSLSMVVIAALVGASGLGVPVLRALGQVNTALGFESGFIIVVVAIMLDRMLRVTKT